MKNPVPLTDRFSDAFVFAEKAHRLKARKSTTIPYISHLMAVSAFVLEYGGTEDQAVAALLHDVVEDCRVPFEEISRRFGPAVERIVRDCTDATEEPKPLWKPRKLKYIAHLAKEAGADSLLVSAADKLHNARAIVRDVRRDGPAVWNRFNAKAPDILWYYEELAAIFATRAADGGPGLRELSKDLTAEVAAMHKLATDVGREGAI